MPSHQAALKNFAAVVITGVSSGIGKSYIELLGTLRPELAFCNLSRRTPDINIPKLKLRHVPCDLSDSEQVEKALAAVLDFLAVDAPTGGILLVNNSGFGLYGNFPEPATEQQLEMVDLNVRAVLHLTGALLPTLKARGGAIITVASTAAFQPTPYLAAYGATKAFVLHWSMAPTSTDFFMRAGLEKGSVPNMFGETSERVVLAALRALAAGKSMVVSGWKNKLQTAVSSKFPKPFVSRMAGIALARWRLNRVKK